MVQTTGEKSMIKQNLVNLGIKPLTFKTTYEQIDTYELSICDKHLPPT